jgi:hypothetical protein
MVRNLFDLYLQPILIIISSQLYDPPKTQPTRAVGAAFTSRIPFDHQKTCSLPPVELCSPFWRLNSMQSSLALSASRPQWAHPSDCSNNSLLPNKRRPRHMTDRIDNILQAICHSRVFSSLPQSFRFRCVAGPSGYLSPQAVIYGTGTKIVLECTINQGPHLDCHSAISPNPTSIPALSKHAFETTLFSF